jgi:hypothetical protein
MLETKQNEPHNIRSFFYSFGGFFLLSGFFYLLYDIVLSFIQDVIMFSLETAGIAPLSVMASSHA